MLTQTVEHEGASCTLSLDDSTLTLAPSLATSPNPVKLAEVACVVQREGTEGVRYTAVHLTSTDGALPAIHQLVFSSPRDDSASVTGSTAFRSLVINASAEQQLHLIVNPAAGARRALPFARNVVLPLLEAAGVETKLHETEGVEDAARIARELSRGSQAGIRNIAVVGGDGTVHEVLNGLLMVEGELVKPKTEVHLVLLPLGTANALFYHFFPPEGPLTPSSGPLSFLYSLLAFIRRQSSPSPLSVALNTFPSSDTAEEKQNVITSVVTSSALHACLLHDAEGLRSSIPGVERFKVAAHQNASLWWEGRLTLNSGAKAYDVVTKDWRPLKEEERSIGGPFAYVVSSLVSRFEPTFIVAPLRSPLSTLKPDTTEGSIDLVLIRPLRDLVTSALVEKREEDKAKEGFVDRLWQVMGGMYDGGKHLDVRYDGEGGVEVVEYLRCSGFSWEPTPSDDLKSNLVCLDGALKDLGRGNKLSTEALGAAATNLSVWA